MTIKTIDNLTQEYTKYKEDIISNLKNQCKNIEQMEKIEHEIKDKKPVTPHVMPHRSPYNAEQHLSPSAVQALERWRDAQPTTPTDKDLGPEFLRRLKERIAKGNKKTKNKRNKINQKIRKNNILIIHIANYNNTDHY
jgi:hypothetical protein